MYFIVGGRWTRTSGDSSAIDFEGTVDCVH